MQQRSFLSIFFSIFFVIIGFIVLHYTGVLTGTEQFLRRLFTPVSKTIFSVSSDIRDTTERIQEDTPERVKTLETALLACRVDTTQIHILEEENQELKAQLNFFLENQFEHVGAEVVGRNIQPLGNTLVINKGTEHGITEGNAVIISNGILIGKISQAEKDSSLVRLISDNQSKIAATILNVERSLGIVEGGYGISVRMNFIPQQEDVRVGDLVITSGLEEGMPRGLLIGNVAAVEKEAYEPFQRAVLNPAASLSSITLVSVITKNSQEE